GRGPSARRADRTADVRRHSRSRRDGGEAGRGVLRRVSHAPARPARRAHGRNGAHRRQSRRGNGNGPSLPAPDRVGLRRLSASRAGAAFHGGLITTGRSPAGCADGSVARFEAERPVTHATAASPTGLPRRFRAWAEREVATLYPGSFALVMATGIISNAFFFEERRLISDLLFAVNVVAYPWLLAATLLRAVRHSAALWADLLNPRLVFSFFTIVAATDVFGLGIDLRGAGGLARGMWVFALLLWFALIYFSFSVLIFLNTAHDANVVHGGWLIAIVGTESLVILGIRVAETMGDLAPFIHVLVHMLWGVG